jgi:hypothetical protein
MGFSIVITSDPQYPWYDTYVDHGQMVHHGYPDPQNEKPEDDKEKHSLAQIKGQYKSINDLAEQQKQISPVRAVLINGDLTAYGHASELSAWVAAVNQLKVDCYPALGNHDYQGNEITTFNDPPGRMVDFMRGWLKTVTQTPGARVTSFDFKFEYKPLGSLSAGSLAYSFNLGDLHLVMLHNYPFYERRWSHAGAEYDITSSFEWLKIDLAQARQRGDAILVFTHSYNDRGCFERADQLKDFNELMSKHQVSAVFAGHIHWECKQISTIRPGDIPVFRSGAASQQDYLVADVDLDLPKMKVTVYDSKTSPPSDEKEKYRASSQPLWSGPLMAGNCVSVGDGAQPGGGIVALSEDRQVFYVGSNQHIHQAWFRDNEWKHADLTDVIGQGRPSQGGPAKDAALKAGVAALSEARQVFYVGTDQHIHVLWYGDNEWKHADLTDVIRKGGPSQGGPAKDAALEAGVAALSEARQVFYVGTDQHIHVLWYGDNEWKHADLTDVIRQGGPSQGGPAQDAALEAGIVALSEDRQVFYVGSDRHIHQLWYRDNEWKHADLTKGTYGAIGFPRGPARDAAPGSGIAAVRNPRQVFYVGDDHHVHQLSVGQNNRWQYTDVTSVVSEERPAPNAAFGRGLAALPDLRQVFYVGDDHHVHRLWLPKNEWKHFDLMTLAGRPTAVSASGSGIAALPDRPQVFYVGDDEHVHQLWCNRKSEGLTPS